MIDRLKVIVLRKLIQQLCCELRGGFQAKIIGRFFGSPLDALGCAARRIEQRLFLFQSLAQTLALFPQAGGCGG